MLYVHCTMIPPLQSNRTSQTRHSEERTVDYSQHHIHVVPPITLAQVETESKFYEEPYLAIKGCWDSSEYVNGNNVTSTPHHTTPHHSTLHHTSSSCHMHNAHHTARVPGACPGRSCSPSEFKKQRKGLYRQNYGIIPIFSSFFFFQKNYLLLSCATSVRPSVCLSVRPSVRPSVRLWK